MGQGNYGKVPEQEKDVTQYSSRKYEDVLTIREYLGERYEALYLFVDASVQATTRSCMTAISSRIAVMYTG